MGKTADSREIAGVLYEALVGTAIDQLRAAAASLGGISANAPDLGGRIEATLPPTTYPEVRKFLLSLAGEGEWERLGEVVRAFEGLSRTAQILDAEVTSASALAAEQRTRISTDLAKRYGVAENKITFRVDETLIGGLIIRIGDQVLDNSLRSRLGAVQRNMLAS